MPTPYQALDSILTLNQSVSLLASDLVQSYVIPISVDVVKQWASSVCMASPASRAKEDGSVIPSLMTSLRGHWLKLGFPLSWSQLAWIGTAVSGPTVLPYSPSAVAKASVGMQPAVTLSANAPSTTQQSLWALQPTERKAGKPHITRTLATDIHLSQFPLRQQVSTARKLKNSSGNLVVDYLQSLVRRERYNGSGREFQLQWHLETLPQSKAPATANKH